MIIKNIENDAKNRFVKLQEEIDKLTVSYLDSHPQFISVARAKDAALKGNDKDNNTVKSLLTNYPGVIAIAVHDAAHKLHKAGKIVEARELAEAAKSRTGIDIHPGARIGINCFIDHGTGVVIGETAVIGDNVQIYHGVTLGAYGDPQEDDLRKLAHRHPQIGDNCTISTGVEILGNVKIGNNVIVGSSSVLHGHNLYIGDNVMMGSSVKIGDKNTIAGDITIGTGAIIPKCTGLINESVAAYSHAIKEEGKIKFSGLKDIRIQLGAIQSGLDKIRKFLGEKFSDAVGMSR